MRETLKYPIKTPSGKTILPPKNGWRWSEDVLLEKIASREIRFVDDETRVQRRIYLTDQSGRTPENLWIGERFGTTRSASSQLKEIFGEDPFETKKPVELIQCILDAVSLTDGVILDSFAGSGTTAHAVLKQNSRDGGTRSFVLVEMEDYADNLTAERVRRTIVGYEYSGTQKTELFREKLNWKKLQNFSKIEEEVEKIENLHGQEYDKLKKVVANGELVVTGEKKVDERAEGLGGEFTYCTLGAPIEMDKILTGENLPSFVDLATVLFHTATNLLGDLAKVDADTYYKGEANGQMLWLIYKPELDWLKTPEAALSLSFARKVSEESLEVRHLVFAPANHTNPKMLSKEGLKVEFAPLPYALYRVEKA